MRKYALLGALAFALLGYALYHAGLAKLSDTSGPATVQTEPAKPPTGSEPAPIQTEPAKLPDTSASGPLPMRTEPLKLSYIPEGYIATDIVFSPGGWGAAFLSKREGKTYIFTGDERSGAYESAMMLTISPDGHSAAFSAVKGDRGIKEVLVAGGVENSLYNTVCNPRFSPDGSKFAFEAERDNRWRVVFGRHESQSAQMSFMPPLWSPDGRLVVYVLEMDMKMVVFIGDASTGESRKLGTYDGIGPFSFSADGSRFAFVGRKEGRFFSVSGGFDGNIKEGAAYESVREPALSSDGSGLAYIGKKAGRLFLVHNGKESAEAYDKVRNLAISPDGSKAAAVISAEGKQFVMKDGPAGKAYDAIQGAPVFSSDGMLAYAAMDSGKWFMVTSGSEGPAYDMVTLPVWSPDGRHMAYRARKGDEQSGERFVVIADSTGNVVKEGPAHAFVFEPVWSPDGMHAGYGVVTKDSEIWWQVETLQ